MPLPKLRKEPSGIKTSTLSSVRCGEKVAVPAAEVPAASHARVHRPNLDFVLGRYQKHEGDVAVIKSTSGFTDSTASTETDNVYSVMNLPLVTAIPDQDAAKQRNDEESMIEVLRSEDHLACPRSGATTNASRPLPTSVENDTDSVVRRTRWITALFPRGRRKNRSSMTAEIP